MKQEMITIGSDVGVKLGLVADLFESAIVWDARPQCIYFTCLYPQQGREKEALETLLERLNKISTPAEFTAPSDMLLELAKQYYYDYYVDPAGTPRINNSASKFLI